MGTKYNGLITFFLMTLFVPFIMNRHGKTMPGLVKILSHSMLFAAVAMIVFSPWAIRDYVWTGNPVYPLFDGFFNPDSGHAAREVSPFVYRSFAYGESWWEIALIPLRIFFQGQDGNPQYFDGKMNPFLLILQILAFYKKRADTRNVSNEKVILLSFSLLFFCFTFFSNVLRVRYISPIIPPLVILSVFGLRKMFLKVAEIHSHNGRILGMGLVCLMLALCFSFNVSYIVSQFRYVDPFSYLSGSLSRDAYISKYRREYPAIKYINRNLHADDLVLFVFLGNRGYYCDKNYESDNGWLYRIIKNSDSPERVLYELENRRVTHLLISYEIFNKWKKEVFNDKELIILNKVISGHCKPLFFKWGYGLSQIGSLK